MDEKLWKAECDPTCAFMVRSHKKDEVTKIIKEHANTIHNENYTDQDALKMVQPV